MTRDTMMGAAPEALYKAHVQNLRMLDTGLDRLFRELNGSISRQDEKTSDSLLKATLLLLGAWAEVRLNKMLFEPHALSGVERDAITGSNTQLETWKKALEVAFRKKYMLPNANLATSLPLTPRMHYNTLRSLIESELSSIIEIRNKLAHGQWARMLNSAGDDFSPPHMAMMSRENALSTKSKKRMMEYIARIIHDLVVGSHAFERDFDKHFSNVENAKRDITHRSYQTWQAIMQSKFLRGKSMR